MRNNNTKTLPFIGAFTLFFIVECISIIARARIEIIVAELLVTLSSLSYVVIAFERAKMRSGLARKDAYEKVLEARRLTFVSELIGNVAHEINNPLAIIQACVLRMERCALDVGSPEFLQLVMNMEDAYTRVSAVRDGLGLFAAGNKKDKLEAIDVRALFTRVLQQERPLQHANHLVFSDRSQGLRILCRARQIGSALTALIENALDAIHARENGRVLVEAFLDKENLCLSVTDNGQGIPEDIREKIFLPFFTGHPQKGSRGLGLSVSRGTIAEHGGHLDYETRLGQTRFTIRLPLKLSHQELYYPERRFS